MFQCFSVHGFSVYMFFCKGLRRAQESDFHGRQEFFINPTYCIKTIMILTLTMSRSLITVPNGHKDYFQKCGTQFTNLMPLMNTFTFLTFTRSLAIPRDVSVAVLKHSFAFISHFIAEEGYSILTKTSSHKVLSLVSDKKIVISYYHA